MSGKDHWDAILASAPLNATAGAVTGKGYGFKPAALRPEHTWLAPPPMKRDLARLALDPNFRDYTGLKSGRLTVLGMAEDNADQTGNKGALWVCRCACGKYVGRRGKGLRTGKTTACNECNYTDHLRWSASSGQARKRAEAPEARKWLTPEEQAAKKDAA